MDARDGPRRDHRAVRGRAGARQRRANASGARPRDVPRRDVEVDGSLSPPHRKAAADARLFSGLVKAELHDGAVEAARGANTLHPPLQEQASLPRGPHRPLVHEVPDDLLRPRGRARRAHRHALLRALSLGIRGPDSGRHAGRDHRDDATRDDSRGRRGGRASGRCAMEGARRQGRPRAGGGTAREDHRRRGRRSGIRHRGAQDHARPRRDRLRDRAAPRSPGAFGHRQARDDDASRGTAGRSGPRHCPPDDGGKAAHVWPSREGGAGHACGGRARALRHGR